MGLYCLCVFVNLSVFIYKDILIYMLLCSLVRLLLPTTSSVRDIIEISFLLI